MRTIYWKLPNGYIGHGSPIDSHLAADWLNHLNRTCWSIVHWLQ